MIQNKTQRSIFSGIATLSGKKKDLPGSMK